MVSPRQLLDFASAYNLLIFEDAAQAHLAQREGYTAGGVGIAAAYSFYPSNNLGSCGDGGMVLTNNAEVAQKVRSLRNYGAPRKYYHTEFGINSRLDNLQAAILNVLLVSRDAHPVVRLPGNDMGGSFPLHSPCRSPTSAPTWVSVSGNESSRTRAFNPHKSNN